MITIEDCLNCKFPDCVGEACPLIFDDKNDQAEKARKLKEKYNRELLARQKGKTLSDLT